MIQITKVVQPTEGAIVVARCPLCKVTHIGSNWRLVKPADGDYWLLAGCPLSAHRDVPLNCEVASAQPDPTLRVDSITDLPPNGYVVVDEFSMVDDRYYESNERVLQSQWRSS